jgi:ribosomal-protein-alanine acetyltransferase
MPVARATTRTRVRRARRGDHAALLALERRSFRGDRLSPRQLRRHLDNRRAWLAVAERNGAVLGDALLLFRAGSAIARLYSIAVAPEARGAGVGARLLRAAEAAARARGCRRLRLEVRADNAAAIALYEARGYRRFGRRPGYYDDGADAWRYQRELGRRR